MSRIEPIAALKRHAEALKRMGATSLYVFGSTVRGKEPANDLDLFIDYDPEGHFNAFDLVGIKNYLEDRLNIPVDLTTRDGLHPMLKSEIEQTAVQVF
jgi:uncharacterized protein